MAKHEAKTMDAFAVVCARNIITPTPSSAPKSSDTRAISQQTPYAMRIAAIIYDNNSGNVILKKILYLFQEKLLPISMTSWFRSFSPSVKFTRQNHKR